MYVCGPTVYNFIHIGNARPMIVFDTVRRYMEYKGYEVNYVSNFTDVDDKIIAKAIEEGVSAEEISTRYIKECKKDMADMNVKPATTHPLATQEIDGMIEMIQTLIDKGFAYEVNGTVYFRVKNFKEYGKLSHKNLEDLQSGFRSLQVSGEDQKEDPLDFVLWKPKKEGEPYWVSPWGEGRPGWHIECSVMSKKYLGEEIDIHAGGEDLTATLEYKEEETDPEDVALKVTLKGLRGGHSGIQIGWGHANANKLMARFLNQVIAYDEACLVSWEGGNMRNAIPRECEAIITIPAEEVEDVLAFVGECEHVWRDEYATIEDGLSFTAERVELPKMMVPEEIRDNLVDAIYACPNGVERYIPTIPDTVETSSNLAIVDIKNGKATVQILTRSSRDSMKDYLNTSIESCFSMAGMQVVRSGSYSGWEPNVNSPILRAMKESYKAQFGDSPEVKVIHAGLECGIIGATIPGLDMISFGPTLQCPHTPEERCNIASVKKFYDFLIATLENTP